jgi:hypothetical protein
MLRILFYVSHQSGKVAVLREGETEEEALKRLGTVVSKGVISLEESSATKFLQSLTTDPEHEEQLNQILQEVVQAVFQSDRPAAWFRCNDLEEFLKKMGAGLKVKFLR